MEGERRLTVFVTGANGGGVMVQSRKLRGRLHDQLGKKQGGGGWKMTSCLTSVSLNCQRILYPLHPAIRGVELEQMAVQHGVEILCDLYSDIHHV